MSESGKTTERHAEGRSDPTIDQSLVQPCSYGPKEGWDAALSVLMPFGLSNAPAVFQRLMERVLAGLNPEQRPDFVKVYIDHVLVFSPTLTDHLHHLRQVFDRIRDAGLKLKPTKCWFVTPEVEY